MKYPVAETFLSIQGEGLHAGRRAFFIRLYGCDVRCPWCDSVYAWSGNSFSEKSADELAAAAAQSGAELAVITGGEPCMFDLSELAAALSVRGIKAHLETSGVHEIVESTDCPRKNFSFVALSPKLFRPPLEKSLARADELKFIVSDLSEIPLYEKISAGAKNASAFWLHPEWSKIGDKNLLAGICGFVESRGGLWRAGWQMHKNYAAR